MTNIIITEANSLEKLQKLVKKKRPGQIIEVATSSKSDLEAVLLFEFEHTYGRKCPVFAKFIDIDAPANRRFFEAKKLNRLETDLDKWLERQERFESLHKATLRKSNKFRCDNCRTGGDKTWIVDGNLCPVCGSDLRSKTIKDKSESYKIRISEIHEEIQAAREKLHEFLSTTEVVEPEVTWIGLSLA